MGISWDDSSKWQKIANLEEDKFEEVIEEIKLKPGNPQWSTDSTIGKLPLDKEGKQLKQETLNSRQTRELDKLLQLYFVVPLSVTLLID